VGNKLSGRWKYAFLKEYVTSTVTVNNATTDPGIKQIIYRQNKQTTFANIFPL